MEGDLLVKWLRYNLLDISQLCDKEYFIVFNTFSCLVEHKANTSIVFKGSKVDNIYLLDLDDVSMYGINV